MKNLTVRDERYLSRLADFLRREYGLTVCAITPAQRGFYGETWRLDTDANRYFAKLVSSAGNRPLYERSFHVIEHMNRCGIDFISRIVPSRKGALHTHFEGAAVGVFDWIEGETVQSEHTKLPEYDMLAKVYAVATEGLQIPREQFEMEGATLFFRQWDALKRLPDSAQTGRLLLLFDSNQGRFERLLARLRLFAGQCKADLSCQYITHGDAGGNVIASGDRFYIVDWDDPVIAPPERDAWFCLNWDWAMEGFNEALRRNGIAYALRRERLAYYCYHSYFWYLAQYIGSYLEEGDIDGSLVAEIVDYVPNSWINEAIAYADAHY